VCVAARPAHLPPQVLARMGRELWRLGCDGVDIICSSGDNPDLPPPRHIIDAQYESPLRSHRHGYTRNYRLPALRRTIANYYERRFRVHLDPDRDVAVLVGSKEGQRMWQGR